MKIEEIKALHEAHRDEIIAAHNRIGEKAERELSAMSAAEEDALAAEKRGDKKAAHKASVRYDRHANDWSFALGQQAGIDLVVCTLGYRLIIEDGVATGIAPIEGD